jgi:hypothetical protein
MGVGCGVAGGLDADMRIEDFKGAETMSLDLLLDLFAVVVQARKSAGHIAWTLGVTGLLDTGYTQKNNNNKFLCTASASFCKHHPPPTFIFFLTARIRSIVPSLPLSLPTSSTIILTKSRLSQ